MSKEDNAFGLDKIITKISRIEVPDLSNEHLSDKGEKVQKPDYKSEEKKHIHFITISMLYGLASCACAIAIVIVLHLIFPKHWRWLEHEEIMNLKSIFVSGVGGAILAKFDNKF